MTEREEFIQLLELLSIDNKKYILEQLNTILQAYASFQE